MLREWNEKVSEMGFGFVGVRDGIERSRKGMVI